MSPARRVPSRRGQLPARPRLHRPQGRTRRGGREPCAYRSAFSSPAAPGSGRSLPIGAHVHAAPPAPGSTSAQDGGEQPRGAVARRARPLLPRLSPAAAPRARPVPAEPERGSPAGERPFPAGAPAAAPAGVPSEPPAPLTSFAASPAAGLAVAVIHAVQDDQGKGEEAKLHPGPLGWADSSGGSEGR